MKFPKLQKAIEAMRIRLGIPSRPKSREIPIDPIRPKKRWNPNQRQLRKDRRRAFAAGCRKAFS